MLRRRILGVLVAVVGLTSCAGVDPSEDRAVPTLPIGADSYVALGDSFVSGPGIEPQQRDGGACLRSERNWPVILSKELGLSHLRDVSCAGARTQHMFDDLGDAKNAVPAQLDSLRRSTDLITLGIGANDDGMIQGLVVACSSATMPTPHACSDFVESALPRILHQSVQPNVARILDEVRRRSPDALVLLIGYLRLAPEGESCSGFPVKSRHLPDFVMAERAIDAALASAAIKAGVRFMSAYELSEGHDACAGDQAWVNGDDPREGDGEILHPRASGMRAVAIAAGAALR